MWAIFTRNGCLPTLNDYVIFIILPSALRCLNTPVFHTGIFSLFIHRLASQPADCYKTSLRPSAHLLSKPTLAQEHHFIKDFHKVLDT
jgi:hypothetical protein